METNDLKLYYASWCPYSRKVLRCLEDNGIELELHDVDHGDNLGELVECGGSSQVPCLVIDGEALYESDDIIAYLENRLDRA